MDMALKTVTMLERTKKQLRSVLISMKDGVAAKSLEEDYDDLVSGQSLQQYILSSRWGKLSPSASWVSRTWRPSSGACLTSAPWRGGLASSLCWGGPARPRRT